MRDKNLVFRLQSWAGSDGCIDSGSRLSGMGVRTRSAGCQSQLQADDMGVGKGLRACDKKCTAEQRQKIPPEHLKGGVHNTGCHGFRLFAVCYAATAPTSIALLFGFMSKLVALACNDQPTYCIAKHVRQVCGHKNTESSSAKSRHK